jgi:hypothetical protein
MLIVLTTNVPELERSDVTVEQPSYSAGSVIEVPDWTGQMLIKARRAKPAAIRIVHKYQQWMTAQVSYGPDVVIVDVPAGYDPPAVSDNPPLNPF